MATNPANSSDQQRIVDFRNAPRRSQPQADSNARHAGNALGRWQYVHVCGTARATTRLRPRAFAA